jgi:hypothetical protein
MTTPGHAGRHLAVVYDVGAALPLEIARATRKLGKTTFVLGPSEHVGAARSIFRPFGTVLSLDDGFDTVVRTLRRSAVAGVVTFSERMLGVTQDLAGTLGLPRNAPATVRLLTDKLAQRQRLRERGLSTVRSALLRTTTDVDAALARIGLPAVLKPRIGEASRDTHLLTDPAAGRELARRLLAVAGEFVVEQFLAGRDEAPYGDYVSVECAVVAGAATAIAVTGKLPLLPPFRESGQFWPPTLPAHEAQAASDMAVRAVTALGMRAGIAHVELKLTSTGPAVVEVNGRLGGFQPDLAARAVGLDVIELAGRIALGDPVNIPPVRPDRVYFQYWCPAPTKAIHFVDVTGVRRVLGIDGVTGYLPLIRTGSALPGGVGTQRLGMLCGDAPDHEHMIKTLDLALRHLTYRFRTDEGDIVVAAADVPTSESLNPRTRSP